MRPGKTQQPLARRLRPYVWLSPALITITVLSLFPMVFTVILAFTDASLYTFQGGISYIGLANFKEIFQGAFAKVFFPVFGWNIIYTFASALSQYAVGMFLAVLLNNPNLKESRLYRSLLIIPWAIPGAIAALAWTGMFSTSYGLINQFLTSTFGIDAIRWLQEPNLARTAVLIVNLWLGFPFMMTICLGALQAIPGDLYEAASIDGATKWQQFWRITFPMMLRFSIPLVVGSIAFNFNNFNTALMLVDGGPALKGPFPVGATDLLASVGYKLTVNSYRYGLSAALSIILFVLVAALSLFNMKVTGAFGEEE